MHRKQQRATNKRESIIEIKSRIPEHRSTEVLVTIYRMQQCNKYLATFATNTKVKYSYECILVRLRLIAGIAKQLRQMYNKRIT